MTALAQQVLATRRSHRPAPKWRDGATAEELALVAEIDARLDAIAAERAELTRARSLLTNRCCQRAIQASRATIVAAPRACGAGPLPSSPICKSGLPDLQHSERADLGQARGRRGEGQLANAASPTAHCPLPTAAPAEPAP